jgi:putative addiction module component (TIGR02574 family)
LVDALRLPPVERAELIERILESFPFPDRKEIDELWAAEAEERIDAFERGEIKAKPASGLSSPRPTGYPWMQAAQSTCWTSPWHF